MTLDEKKKQLAALIQELSPQEVYDAFSMAEEAVGGPENMNVRCQMRVPVIDQYNAPDPSVKTVWGIALDTETTGLDTEVDQIVELSLIAFEFDKQGRIYRVKTLYNGFEEPSIPISEEASRKTGITMEMVKGHRFDDELVNKALGNAAILIAHNSGFDRKMVERRYPIAEQKHWGCTLKDIDWENEPVEGARLKDLLEKDGFFFKGHRAEIDVRAMIHMLAHDLEVTGGNALVSMLDTMGLPTYHFYALGADFSKKDALKDRDYKWHPGDATRDKCWHKEIQEHELADELEFMRTHIYPNDRYDRFVVEKIGSLERYSRQPGETVKFDRNATTAAPVQPEKRQDGPKQPGLKGLVQ